MTDFWITQGLLLTGHLLSAWAMLCLFSPAGETMRTRRALVTILLYVVINLAVETHLHSYLREGTLVFQWVLFVLLAYQWVRLPLVHAMGSMFCVCGSQPTSG